MSRTVVRNKHRKSLAYGSDDSSTKRLGVWRAERLHVEFPLIEVFLNEGLVASFHHRRRGFLKYGGSDATRGSIGTDVRPLGRRPIPAFGKYSFESVEEGKSQCACSQHTILTLVCGGGLTRLHRLTEFYFSICVFPTR